MSSVRTNLRSAISNCIKEMSVTGGYNNAYLDVNDPPKNMEQMSRYPTVNILYGQERRQGNKFVGNNPILDIQIPLQFDIFIHDINDTMLAQDKVISDFQKYFGQNYYVRPASGLRAAFNCIWLSSTGWGTEREVPNCGVTLEFELFYSIRLNDPSLMI